MHSRHGFLLLAALVAVVGGVRAREDAYPRPELLVEPAQLAQPDVAQQFIILDARERPAYEQGHVPNARWVDAAAWAKAFGQGKDAEGWSQRIGGLGIGPDSRVVLYDATFGKDAARIWWLLRYWGVKDVRLLNGGWQGWKAGAYPTDKGDTPPTPVKFVAQARPERLATKDQLLKALDGDKPQIVDARSEKEYCGVEKMTNKRAGAVPGAKQLEWIDMIDKETQRFKAAADLRKLFEQAGIALDKPTTTYCQSGGRASVLAFGLELMGAKDVRNYYASWNEWGNADDTPVAPGQPKEKK
jgi:thiosulfate/3-mercaptopyruvate sulfurtransferase